jgi:hypothetical protein
MQLTLDPRSIDSYEQFLAVKRLPAWRIRGRVATFPDEYSTKLGIAPPVVADTRYTPEPFLYDYQAAIVDLAIRRRKFAAFCECGLGKTNIIFSYARHVQQLLGHSRRVLILAPAMVVQQHLDEAAKWFPELKVERVTAANLAAWLESDGDTIGVTNYEALKSDTPQGKLGCLIPDESSILKSMYGAYGDIVLRLGRGLDWKLCATGTPAPNDRIEYANHAVFLDRFPTVNSFLATYFVNRGQTGERWEIKPHALRPFYRALSDWCIFLSNPGVYGWKDNSEPLPPIHTHIHDVEMTDEQRQWMRRHLGTLVATKPGGITKRSALGQVAKGEWKGETFPTNKPRFIADLVSQWRDAESTLVWCIYDHEQEGIHAALGGDSMDGKTPMAKRLEMIDRFKRGESRVLVSKSRILGFGLNLQVATRQVFSGLQDSYEAFWQCVKRSNRIGSTLPLNVHIPITELEVPMVETVLAKAKRVESDTREQESLFREAMQ